MKQRYYYKSLLSDITTLQEILHPLLTVFTILNFFFSIWYLMFFRFWIIPAIHYIFGHPLGLFPMGYHFNITFRYYVFGLFIMCSNHLIFVISQNWLFLSILRFLCFSYAANILVHCHILGRRWFEVFYFWTILVFVLICLLMAIPRIWC